MSRKKIQFSHATGNEMKRINIAVLAEEPLGWGSGKHYFPAILDGYSWSVENSIYRMSATYLNDQDILQGMLNISDFDVLLIPGGGVGDSESIIKGFNFLRKVKKWKKNVCRFVKDGGGCVGICGGTALITGLITGSGNTTTTFTERQYNKSSLGITCVNSYYRYLAMPIFYPFQRKYPEKTGAMAYVFSFAPGEIVDGTKVFTGGVPIDFPICYDHPIFSDYSKKTIRIRWWGGPALVVPENLDRDVKILARYPSQELSENDSTKIHAWRYTGGIRGLTLGMMKAFKLIKTEKESLKKLLTYAYFFAGDWEKSSKLIELNFSNKPCMTAEVYPNKNKGRILLCTAHPEYMIWHGGYIDEVDDNNFNCIATGFHQWKNIAKLSDKAIEELTHTWWIVRRIVAWAAKVPDNHLPPIEKEKITKKEEKILSKQVFWDGHIISQIRDI